MRFVIRQDDDSTLVWQAEANTTLLSAFNIAPLVDDRNQHYGDRRQLQVNLLLEGTDQANLKAKIDALETALRTKDISVGFLHDDDTTLSTHWLSGATSDSPVQLVGNVSYSPGQGPELGSKRTLQATFGAEYHDASPAEIMAWQETYSIRGTGGARFTHRTRLNGLPTKWTLNTNIPARAVQSGTAFGYSAYPNLPSPIATATDEKLELRVNETIAPQYNGKTFTRWGRRWAFFFERALPFTGTAPAT